MQFLRPSSRIPLCVRGRCIGPGDQLGAAFDLKIEGACLTVRRKPRHGERNRAIGLPVEQRCAKSRRIGRRVTRAESALNRASARCGGPADRFVVVPADDLCLQTSWPPNDSNRESRIRRGKGGGDRIDFNGCGFRLRGQWIDCLPIQRPAPSLRQTIPRPEIRTQGEQLPIDTRDMGQRIEDRHGQTDARLRDPGISNWIRGSGRCGIWRHRNGAYIKSRGERQTPI